MYLISITAVGVRLFALLIFFNILRETTRMVSLVSSFDSYEFWPVVALLLFVFFFIGMVLWRHSIAIAEKVVPKGIAIENASPCNIHRPIYQLAFVILGSYVLIYGVSDLFYTGQVYFALSGTDVGTDQLIKQRALMVSSIIEICIGLFLVVGARGVSKLVYLIRYGGIDA